MSHQPAVTIDPKDYRIDGRLARRIWMLCRPFWLQRRHWPAWLMVSVGLAVGPLWGLYDYQVAQMVAKQAGMLAAKNQPEWVALFWLLLLLGLGRWIAKSILGLFEFLVKMQWYRWMTDWMIGRYLENRVYYDIALRDDLDNPDERIQDHVEPMVSAVLEFPGKVLVSITALLTYSLLLSQVSGWMTIFVMVWSLIGMTVQTILQIPLIRKNFDLVAANADFRYGLLRVRDNAEPIAFLRGEGMERMQVSSRLHRYVRHKLAIYYYELKINVVMELLTDVWSIAPLFLVFPLYFDGKIDFAAATLAGTAAQQLRQAIWAIRDYVPFLAKAAPSVVRLAQIVERFDRAHADASRTGGQIRITLGDRIVLNEVSFETPGGEQLLARRVSLEIAPGGSLMIVGRTGVGKSSVLRAMAGLWTTGSGTMTMPTVDRTMFVPQRPYIMLGDLRAQLLYPGGHNDMPDAEIQAVLEQVCLPDLIDKAGGLDIQRDWAKVLSLGEQQRISFARILISRPDFVFLDEATSATDRETEAVLYEALIATGATYVSVGHRSSILRYHDRALRLSPNGAWEMLVADEV